MKQLLIKLANKIVDGIDGRSLTRMAYFIVIAALAFYGLTNPEAAVKIIQAISKALSFLL